LVAVVVGLGTLAEPVVLVVLAAVLLMLTLREVLEHQARAVKVVIHLMIQTQQAGVVLGSPEQMDQSFLAPEEKVDLVFVLAFWALLIILVAVVGVDLGNLTSQAATVVSAAEAEEERLRAEDLFQERVVDWHLIPDRVEMLDAQTPKVEQAVRIPEAAAVAEGLQLQMPDIQQLFMAVEMGAVELL
jgi:hypothetical protein